MRKLTKKARRAMASGGRKGGKAKVPKGFAMMDKDKYSEMVKRRKLNREARNETG